MSHAAEPGLAAFNTRYPLRRILILVAAFAAPIVGYGQMALGLGQSPSEFSADGDQTLRVAGYAFSIWAVIYAWLIAYGVYQALPATSESDTARRLGWPSFAALVGIALWVIASAADWEWLTVVLIVGSLAAVLVPLLKVSGDDPIKRRALIVWPLAMLAGWLTIASLVNLLTVLTSQGFLTPENALPAALAAVAAAVVAALAVTARTRVWTYPAPIAWGLAAVFFAERSEGDSLLGFTALGAAFLAAIGAAVILARRRNVSVRAEP